LYLNPGNYKVTLIVTSSNGCKDTTTKNVNVFAGPVGKFSAENVCLHTNTVFKNESIMGTGTFSSSWIFEDETSESFSPTKMFRTPGTHQVQLKVFTNQGCRDSITRFVEVYSLPNVNAGSDTTIEKGFDFKLNASGAKSYLWYPAEGLSNPTIHNPKVSSVESIEYIVEGTDFNGCQNSDTILINIDSRYTVFPMNIVTPDHNGLNDRWSVLGIDAYPDNHLKIFDQWNELVFETTSYNNTWDGRNQQNDILPDATYFYVLTFANSKKKYSGYITLIRNTQ
jgi:gliding motility-associated-like protein